MRAQGFSLAAAGTAFALLDAHLYGFMLQEVSLPFEGEADLAALGAEILGPEVRAAYPHFTAFAEGRALQPGYAFGDEFEVVVSTSCSARSSRCGLGARRAGVADARRPRSRSACRCSGSTAARPDGSEPCSCRERRGRGSSSRPRSPARRDGARRRRRSQVVGIDIPIGLPDSTIRQADVLARRALPGRASSVFTTLTRPAYLARTALEADAVNRGLSGQGVGAQAFALRAKILEVDAWLRTRPTVDVVEVHPEVSFTTMAGAAAARQAHPRGAARPRLDALGAAGIARPVGAQGQRLRRRRRARRLRRRLVGAPSRDRRRALAAGPARGVLRRHPGRDRRLTPQPGGAGAAAG